MTAHSQQTCSEAVWHSGRNTRHCPAAASRDCVWPRACRVGSERGVDCGRAGVVGRESEKIHHRSTGVLSRIRLRCSKPSESDCESRRAAVYLS